MEMINQSIAEIIDTYRFTYSEIIYRLPEKQKEVLIAISKEERAANITSGGFVQKHPLGSASSVQAAIKGLLEKDFITNEQGVFQIYDRFFAVWLKNNF